MSLCRNDTELRMSTEDEQNAPPKSPVRRMPLPYEVRKIYILRMCIFTRVYEVFRQKNRCSPRSNNLILASVLCLNRKNFAKNLSSFLLIAVPAVRSARPQLRCAAAAHAVTHAVSVAVAGAASHQAATRQRCGQLHRRHAASLHLQFR